MKQALFKLKKYQDITKANNKPDNSTTNVPQLLQRQDATKPEDSNTVSVGNINFIIFQYDSESQFFIQTLPKVSKDVFSSGLYANLSPKLPPIGIENETAAPMIDVASQFLKPATGGSEISYHDNLEGPNHKIDKKDKLLI